MQGWDCSRQVQAEALAADCTLSAQDWAKPGPYDQPLVNTLQRRKDKREADTNGGGPATAGGPAAVDEAQRPRSMTVSAATRVTCFCLLVGARAAWKDLGLWHPCSALQPLEDPWGGRGLIWES